MDTNWSKTTKHIVGVGLALFGIFILYVSRSVLGLVAVGALIAFLLMPLIDFFNNKFKMPRLLAVLTAYLLLIVVVLFSPLVFLPPIVDGFNYLFSLDYQILIEQSVNWVEQTLLQLQQVNPQFLGVSINLDSIIEPALDLVQDTGTNIVALPALDTLINSLRSAVTFTFGFATNVAGRVVVTVLTLIVTLLSAIYMSLGAHNFMNYFLSLAPEPYRPEAAKLLSRLRKTWRAYFRGQLYLMLMIGVVTWIGGTAIGLPGALALAFIAGVMELIPNLGPFLAAIPAIIVALIQGSTYLGVSNLVFALIVIGLYILIQQLENTFIVPRILGEAVDLHPLVVMIGVLVGANVAGILGTLLAAPIIASIREILRYLYAKILDEEPFPHRPEDDQEDEEALWKKYGRWLLQKGKLLLAPADKPDTSE